MITRRPAKTEDFSNRVLHDSPFGIFQDVNLDTETLAALIDEAFMVTYGKKGDVVFSQEDKVDGKIRAIVSGAFSIQHTILDEFHTISIDQPGLVTADVEMFVRGIDAKEFGRGQTDHFFATVVCNVPGEILEFRSAPLLRDTSFIFNLGRQVSTKLLRRNADSDRRFLKESKLVAHHLRLTIINRKDEVRNNTLSTSAARQLYLAGVTYAEIARKAGLVDETVRRFALRLQGQDQQFTWEKHVIEMSRDFHSRVIAKDGVAFLQQRARAATSVR